MLLMLSISFSPAVSMFVCMCVCSHVCVCVCVFTSLCPPRHPPSTSLTREDEPPQLAVAVMVAASVCLPGPGLLQDRRGHVLLAASIPS
jgi:hypothetical protein